MPVPLSTLRHREVLNTAAATTVGRVSGLVIDPASHTVVAAALTDTIDDSSVISWTDLSVGPDVVTITSRSAVRPARDGQERRVVTDGLTVIGKRVLSADGEDLGVVHEVLADDETGRIESIDLGTSTRPGSDLIGIGDHAVVVTAG